MLESKAMFLGGDMGSCADLEQFLKRNASTFSAPALWEKIAEKTPSEQVWISYERSFGETDSEKHITVLRQMLQGAPGNGYCAFKLQGLLDDKAGRRDVAGDLPGAVSVYQEAIPLDTQNTQPVQGLEKALSKCNPAERRDVWEKTWRDNPGSPQVAAFCGTARVAAGDIAGAREAFAASQSLAPEDWYSCVLAADALAAVGAWGDAAAAYRRALEQNPKLDYLLPRLEEAGKFDDDCFALQEG